MTRVTRYRIGYVLLLAVLAAAAYLGLRATGFERTAVVGAVVALLIPGRAQGILLRPLFRGRRVLAGGNAPLALKEFGDCLALLRRQPWRSWALWLGWSVYTPSAEAMTWNNLGAAHEALADTASARQAWEQARAIDPLYPVPIANLAVLAAAQGDAARAGEWLAQARQLGYSGGALDRATHRVQQLLAAAESRGPAL
jgi:tetratricopeptide (TPR) repeat protein